MGHMRALDAAALARVCIGATARLLSMKQRRVVKWGKVAPCAGRGSKPISLVVQRLKSGCRRWRFPNAGAIFDAEILAYANGNCGHKISQSIEV
jgi:hypothetical protein